MGASFKSSGDDYGPVSDINITPFVDVMLVLLVIFMVAAPLLESGIPIQLPKANTKALKAPDKPIILNITKEREVYVAETKVELRALIKTLRNVFKERDKKEIFIRADGALPYEFVAQTMAAVKLAGIDKIGLVTVPPGTK